MQLEYEEWMVNVRQDGSFLIEGADENVVPGMRRACCRNLHRVGPALSSTNMAAEKGV